ncbi:DUF1127 domain-containing protein [Pseudomonas nicosulfuronedens]|uniref:DUF1127 domain-containing protein n=1 Tax=Pseudomonas nicosulfuronedens TaxID=2571105 RepID=A0A5R9R7R4_9PSED|nr:DUF1127 domain-containing protein [Pseudomonas nicosulfuronedens]MDH1010288.1 DUF1127 domain-containing protein [Pseudomonas nicosulfuronedens]MDH1980231.1 DUF1127 domain-containing protein [Pseudomonas nicosulfuronedens]MDH2025523.1 DUF1127 domain-containing protein [Pseudomonas nicosulfuronedens]TLX78926.1 DUF1127 domain-containing protein [Pseudomonas nicosulfuronedens]
MKGQLGFVAASCHVHKIAGAPLWKRAVQRVLHWHELARQRRELATMSDEALKDIGLSRADIQQEVERPFWMDYVRR